jgi:hypothetical protein
VGGAVVNPALDKIYVTTTTADGKVRDPDVDPDLVRVVLYGYEPDGNQVGLAFSGDLSGDLSVADLVRVAPEAFEQYELA